MSRDSQSGRGEGSVSDTSPMPLSPGESSASGESTTPNEIGGAAREHPDDVLPEGDADHAVLWQGRVVAYVWVRPLGGVWRRARRDSPVQGLVPFAEIRTFSADVDKVLAEILPKAAQLTGLLMRLGLEGYDVQAGAAHPIGGRRRL